MNRTKVLATNGGRKDSAKTGTPLEPIPSDLPQPPLANYTLPGVILYLTSEFTNLERFKIMTNLEKSEMRFRIQQLTAEVNSLRFLNDKQAVHIRELETALAAKSTSEPSSVPSASREASDDKCTNVPGAAELGQNVKNAPNVEIPAVDLDVLRRLRQQLGRAVRDVYRLLNIPNAASRCVVDIPGAEIGTGDYDELLERADDNTPYKKHDSAAKVRDVFANYTLLADDLLDADAGELPVLTSALEDDIPVMNSLVPSTLNLESDTETVIVDESDEVEGHGVRLGTSVAIAGDKVFRAARHGFCTVQGGEVVLWLRGTCLWRALVGDSNGNTSVSESKAGDTTSEEDTYLNENNENEKMTRSGSMDIEKSRNTDVGTTGNEKSTKSDIEKSDTIEKAETDNTQKNNVPIIPVVGAFPLDKHRAVIVTPAGADIVSNESRTLLVQEKKLRISCAALVENGRGRWGLAFAGREGESSCISVWELTSSKDNITEKEISEMCEPGDKQSSPSTLSLLSSVSVNSISSLLLTSPIEARQIARFDKLGAPITALFWATPKAPSGWAAYNVVYVHSYVLKVCLALKEVSVVYSGHVTCTDVAGPYLLVSDAHKVRVVEVASSKMIASHSVTPGASYTLLYRETPYVVELNGGFRVYDIQFREVAKGEGTVVACDPAFFVVKTGDALKVTAVEDY